MLTDRYLVADVDSHIIEPPDLWSARMSSRWGDQVPHVEDDPASGMEMWIIGGRKVSPVGAFAHAGWPECFPDFPKRFEQIDPGGYDPQARLKWLDDVGVHYQLLYPNILGFHSHAFFRHDLDFATECVQAYNDFMTDFCSIDPTRFIPLTIIPFWDVDASVKEMERAAGMGHRGGIVFSPDLEKVGLPTIQDEHWHPVLAAAQEMQLPVNFHVGFAASQQERKKIATAASDTTELVLYTSLSLLGNARAIAEVAAGGICHRYPDLKFVSVENGVGWLPYFAESMDWQWLNSGAHRAMPDRLLPSEYVHRQVYVMYWFEREALHAALPKFVDNILFETDFPHPTSLSPGPGSVAEVPKDVIEHSLNGLPEDVIGKILQHNATQLYRLDAAPTIGT